MIITESVFSKQFFISSRNPYKESLNIRDFAATLGDIVEKKNSYITDGPRHRLDVAFQLTVSIDSFCKVIVEFTIDGDIYEGQSKLNIFIEYIIETKTAEEGIFSEIFTEYYLKKYFSRNKEAANKKINEIITSVEKNFQLNKV